MYVRLCLLGANEGDAHLVRQIAHNVGVVPQIETVEILRDQAKLVDAQEDGTSLETVFDFIGAHYEEEIGARSRREISELLNALMIPYGRKRSGSAWTLGDLRHRNGTMAVHSEELGCTAEKTEKTLPVTTLSRAGLVALAIAIDQVPGAFATISAWPNGGEGARYDVRANLFWGLEALRAGNVDRFENQLLRPQPSLIINELESGLDQVDDSVFLGTREDWESISLLISPDAQRTAALALFAAAQEANATVDEGAISLGAVAAHDPTTPIRKDITLTRSATDDSQGQTREDHLINGRIRACACKTEACPKT